MSILFYSSVGLACIALILSLYIWNQYSWGIRANKSIRERLQDYMKASDDKKAEFYISRLPNGWEVMRLSYAGYTPVHTLIKQFIDNDMDFARREAQELLEILNQ